MTFYFGYRPDKPYSVAMRKYSARVNECAERRIITFGEYGEAELFMLHNYKYSLVLSYTGEDWPRVIMDTKTARDELAKRIPEC